MEKIKFHENKILKVTNVLIKEAELKAAITASVGLVISIADIILVAGASIGGLIAWVIDGLDGKRNGYCFG